MSKASEAGGMILLREEIIHAKSAVRLCMAMWNFKAGRIRTYPAFAFDFPITQLPNYPFTEFSEEEYCCRRIE